MNFSRLFTPVLAISAFCNLTLAPLEASPQLDELKAGNERFINRKPQKCNLNFTPNEVSTQSQNPIAIILACSDSRVPPEIIFDQSSGDLFIVRLAGNTVDELALGSIEYAVNYLRTPLLVILGHENCGAVASTFKLNDKSFSPNIESLLQQIRPAVEAAKQKYKNASEKELLNHAIHENVRLTNRKILQNSPIVKKALENKTFEIAEAVFSIETGKIEWMTQ